MTQPLIEIQSLAVRYDADLILQDVNLAVCRNDFLGMIGPNGGGKTTLIKAILGLVRPASGKIVFHIPRSRIGYLPQINQIDRQFPITVTDVVRSGKAPEYGRERQRSEIARAEQLLEDMGVIALKHRAIGELSGGQMQRVFLCRALMNEPELLILDEPDTFVDNRFENELYSKLGDLNRKMAIILVSHDVGTISWYVKTIACINRRLHYHPDNRITNEQLEAYNCPLKIISHDDIPHTVLKTHRHEHID
ncbi:MAG: ABC transporter ATP-binding protein [Bacteroidales bacterium]|jgi:zinc transport system ATP-binding protein|nr:ABC transporter ATP-binding protein [Bacteroidales bacterium]